MWLYKMTERLEAMEKWINEPIVRVEERPTLLVKEPTRAGRPKKWRSRLDDLSDAEIERLVAAEGMRLYGSDWLKVTERR